MAMSSAYGRPASHGPAVYARPPAKTSPFGTTQTLQTKRLRQPPAAGIHMLATPVIAATLIDDATTFKAICGNIPPKLSSTPSQ